MRNYYAYDDRDFPPAVDIWDTPKRQAEYDRVRRNHFAFGFDAGMTVEQVAAATGEPQIEPGNVCKVCNGAQQLRDPDGWYACYGCQGTGMRNWVA